MAMEGYRKADIHECCANCKDLRGFGLRSYACRLDVKMKNGTHKRVPDVLYNEDNDDYTNMYYYTCDSFGLHDRFK